MWSAGGVRQSSARSAVQAKAGLAVIRVRPIGTLMMTDEAGGDEKVLAVPVDKLHPFYIGVDSWRSLPSILTERVAHFFQHYKDLEKGKSVDIIRWADPEEAGELIRQSIEAYRKVEA